MALPASGILPVLPNSNDPPISSLGEAVGSRRHYADDANFQHGMSTSGCSLPADGGMGRAHFAEMRGSTGRETGLRHIERKPNNAEFAAAQKRHLRNPIPFKEEVLVMDRKIQVYNEDGNLLKHNQTRTCPLEQSMGQKIRVTNARNGIPYMSGGDKPYPSAEYSTGFYEDYSVPSSAAWATSVAREARRDPTKHSGSVGLARVERMTWKLRRQLEDYSEDMGSVSSLPVIACDEEDSD